MTTPLVWSEREDPGLPWTDCTYSAVLMLAVYGGWTNFPEGIYTNAERNLLESSDSVPDHTGANFFATDEAMDFRYGWHPWRIPDGSEVGLRTALGITGRGYAIAGWNRNLSPHLRRWDTVFDGAHAVFVQPIGGGNVLWLDPLAPNMFAGDVVDIETVMRWAFIPSDARCLTEGEVADEVAVPDVPPAPVPPPPVMSTREERLAREAISLRAQFPAQAAHWANSAMTQAKDGLPLMREDRLAGEVLYLRRVATGTDQPT
jgi:hypothetical protein